MKYRSCIADLPRRKHTSDAKVCFGVSCFLNLWIRFVKNMIRRTRATAKNVFGCRSLSFYFFYGLSFLYILISMGLYFLQYGFQSSDEVIHILLGQYQWREDTEDVGAGATGEAVLLVDELAANFLVRNIEYGSYH